MDHKVHISVKCSKALLIYVSRDCNKILNYLGFRINKLALINAEKNEKACSLAILFLEKLACSKMHDDDKFMLENVG